MTEAPRGFAEIATDAEAVRVSATELSGQASPGRREVLEVLTRLATRVAELTSRLAEVEPATGIDVAHRVAWRQLEEVVAKEKTSWGRNELQTRMHQLLAQAVNDVADGA